MYYSELLGVDGRISLNISFKKLYRRVGIRFFWLRIGATYYDPYPCVRGRFRFR